MFLYNYYAITWYRIDLSVLNFSDQSELEVVSPCLVLIILRYLLLRSSTLSRSNTTILFFTNHTNDCDVF